MKPLKKEEQNKIWNKLSNHFYPPKPEPVNLKTEITQEQKQYLITTIAKFFNIDLKTLNLEKVDDLKDGAGSPAATANVDRLKAEIAQLKTDKTLLQNENNRLTKQLEEVRKLVLELKQKEYHKQALSKTDSRSDGKKFYDFVKKYGTK